MFIISPVVDPSYTVSRGAIREHCLVGFVDRVRHGQVVQLLRYQYRVEWSTDAGTEIPIFPILQIVTPKGP